MGPLIIPPETSEDEEEIMNLTNKLYPYCGRSRKT